jgi:hypothetical protein
VRMRHPRRRPGDDGWLRSRFLVAKFELLTHVANFRGWRHRGHKSEAGARRLNDRLNSILWAIKSAAGRARRAKNDLVLNDMKRQVELAP